MGRKNFGMIYEPSNLIVCGQDYGKNTIRALAPYLFNVYLQNWSPNPHGTTAIETWINGPVNYDLLPFGDPRGVDFRMVFAALGEVGYNGYVTVHQVGTGMDIPTGAQHFADYLRSVASFE